MLRQIVLHGKLKEVHSEPLYFDVDSTAEAIRACCFQVPGFEDSFKEGYYRISLIEDDPENDIDEEMVHFKLGDRVNEIHLIPVMAGAKSSGIGKVVLGVAMIGLAVATWGSSLTFASGAFAIAGPGVAAPAGLVIGSATIAKLGVALVLGGVSQLLSPQVSSGKAEAFERPEQRPSFLFNGPVNVTEQGGPVPLVYGRVRVGSAVVSTGLTTENI